MPSAGRRIERQRKRVKRFQYLMLTLVVLVGAALFVAHVQGYLTALPDPSPLG